MKPKVRVFGKKNESIDRITYDLFGSLDLTIRMSADG